MRAPISATSQETFVFAHSDLGAVALTVTLGLTIGAGQATHFGRSR